MDADQKLILKIDYSKPILASDMAIMFKALDEDFKLYLKENKPMVDDCEVKLALKEIRKGSHIYEFIPLIGTSLFPYLNGESLFQYAEYLKFFYENFIKKEAPNNTIYGDYSKKELEMKRNILCPVIDDQSSAIIINATGHANQTINFNIQNQEATKIQESIDKYLCENEILTELPFSDKTLTIYQARKDIKSIGDRGIIFDLCPKPLQLYFEPMALKTSLLSFSENIFNSNFRVNGQILLNEGNIKAYKIQEIKKI